MQFIGDDFARSEKKHWCWADSSMATVPADDAAAAHKDGGQCVATANFDIGDNVK